MKLILLAALGLALAVGVATATAAPPPDPMLGTWTRTVTKADVKRAHSKKVVAGSKWTLVVGKETSRATSPGSKPFKGAIVIATATTVNIELGAENCLYVWHRAGNTLLFILSSDPNHNRQAILVGTWKRRS
jgi:opacity protein-like surface antigen